MRLLLKIISTNTRFFIMEGPFLPIFAGSGLPLERAV